MPIKSLGESSRAPRVGKLRIGKKEGNRPVSLDHFIVDAPNAPAVQALYGEKPTAILVYLPHPLSDAVWSASYKLYGKTGLRCKGDGEVGHFMENGKIVERACADRGCPYAQPTIDERTNKEKPAQCGPKAIMSFKIAGVPTIGVWQVHVNGLMSIGHFHEFLKSLAEIDPERRGGHGIPFWLEVKRETSGQHHYSRMFLREGQETYETIEGKRARLGSVAEAREFVQHADLAITNDEGELIANLTTPQGQEVEARVELARLIDEAVRSGALVGSLKDGSLAVLRSLNSVTEEEAAERLGKLQAWLARYQETQEEPAAKHKEDAASAKFVFERLTSEEWAALGVFPPEELEHVSRRDMRAAMQWLEGQAA